jgi:hypothetical protein
VKIISGSVCIGCFLAGAAFAQSPVSLSIDTESPELAVAPNFGVLSFETGSLEYANKNYTTTGYFFNPTNTQLITIFRNLGVKSMRLGGDSVDGSYIPSDSDIDSFYGFAKASGVQTVFSLDLLGGTPSEAVSEASYIWDNYATNTTCFAIGNEPDEYGSKDPAVTNFTSYIEQWQPIASAVIASAPGALLGGSDNDSAANSWAPDFVQAEEGNSSVASLHYHYKPLGNAAGNTPAQLIAGELSSKLDASDYPSCYNTIAAPALQAAFGYRFTEFNDYYVGSAGTTNDDYYFGTALFALDALRWWAANGCLGLHFHTGVQGFHAAFFIDGNGDYQLYPIGYGFAAFNVGGSGDVEPMTVNNAGGLNLTAYAIGSGTNLYVTIINREYGGGALSAVATITPYGFAAGNVSAMFLIQSNGDVTATNGVTLGGAAISGAGPWLGQWTSLGMLTNGQCTVVVPAASAAIVRLQATAIASPEIIQNLPAQVSLIPGETYPLSIGVQGGLPLSYQWYERTTPIGSQTNSTYLITGESSGSTTSYFVVITNMNGAATSSISTVTIIAPPTNSYAASILNLNPAGYWPMHERETAARGDIETNYGNLGPLGTGYYPDWALNSGAFVRQVPGALAGDSNTATYFSYPGAPNTGSITNALYVPHASPLSTLNPPFTVECWYNAFTNSADNKTNYDYYVWSQCGYEGLNAGKSGAGGGKVCGIQLYWGPAQLSVQYYDNSSSVNAFNVNDAFGTWVHIVVTCDANTNMSVYVNGVQSGSTHAVAGLYSPDYWTPFELGNGRGNGRAARGEIDEVAIYSTNMAASKILAHYQAGTNAAPATPYFQWVTNDNPVIYLRMDAPPYSMPAVATWPVLTNSGSTGINGLYTPGTMPAVVPVPGAFGMGSFPGLAGLAVPQFSGVSSFADAGNAAVFNPSSSNANFSVVAFFRGDPADNRIQSIIGHGTNSWQLCISTNGCIVFNAGNGNAAAGGTGQAPGDVTTSGIYNDGNWHDVVAVNWTNVISIYVDGVLDTNVIPAGIRPNSLIPGNVDDVMIGSDPSYTNNPVGVGRNFAGQICEAAFFTNALTAVQIQTLYLSAIAPARESLSFKTSTAGSLQLNWNYGALQTATNVTGPYLDMTNVSPPYIVPMIDRQQFFRVKEN